MNSKSGTTVPRWSLALLLLAALVPGTATAQDGQFVRGGGAVSGAMGGTGIAWSGSLMGAFALNPAGLARFDGVRIEGSLEMFRPRFALSTDLLLQDGRSIAGRSESADWRALPAIAIASPLGEKVVLGIAVLSVGGVGVDYPAAETGDPFEALNGALLPQPLGLGRVLSSYSTVKITPALAWKLSDDLWFGANANFVHASWEVRPAMFAGFAPEPEPGVPAALFPDTDGSAGAWGTGMGVGLTYHHRGLFLGVNYQTPTWFQEFEWDAVWPLPGPVATGAPATFGLQLDHPAVAGFGAAYTPSERLVLEVNARRLMYGKGIGFEPADPDAPVADTGAITGLGWQSVWSWGVGGQFGLGDLVELRAGYSHRSSPVTEELVWSNIPTPATAESRLSVGVGLALNGGFEIDAAYSRMLNGEQSGPVYGPLSTGAGGAVTSEISQDSFLVQLAFSPGRR